VGGREEVAAVGDVWSVKCEVLAGCERAGGRVRLWTGCANLRWLKVVCRRLKLPTTAKQRPM
jgi:hypothetical protein